MSRGNVARCNERAGESCGAVPRCSVRRPAGAGRARGRNASFSHREKRMRLSVAGTQWRRDEIRFAGGAGAGAGALIDSRRATAGRLRRIGDSSGPIKLPAVEESCSATHAGETQAAAAVAARRPRVHSRVAETTTTSLYCPIHHRLTCACLCNTLTDSRHLSRRPIRGCPHITPSLYGSNLFSVHSLGSKSIQSMCVRYTRQYL